MSKLVDIDRIKAEIERQQRKLSLVAMSENTELHRDAAIQNGVYTTLLSFLDSLSEEKVDIEKEIEVCANEMPHCEFSHESECIDDEEWLKEKLRYFYNLGKDSVYKKTHTRPQYQRDKYEIFKEKCQDEGIESPTYEQYINRH